MPQRRSRSTDKAQPGKAGRSDETERYKQAANDALEQLDWCIGYLAGIRKARIARSLARNRAYIREHLMREAAEPVAISDQ